MDNEKLLTIAIPTYNGAKTIANMLEILLPQCDERVEVLISDNASTDNTKLIIDKYIEKYEREYIQYPIVKLYKLIFNSRYRARNTELKNKIEQIIKKNDKSIKNNFYENDKINSKIKLLFTIFYHIPATYNIFRWINEKRAR